MSLFSFVLVLICATHLIKCQPVDCNETEQNIYNNTVYLDFYGAGDCIQPKVYTYYFEPAGPNKTIHFLISFINYDAQPKRAAIGIDNCLFTASNNFGSVNYNLTDIIDQPLPYDAFNDKVIVNIRCNIGETYSLTLNFTAFLYDYALPDACSDNYNTPDTAKPLINSVLNTNNILCENDIDFFAITTTTRGQMVIELSFTPYDPTFRSFYMVLYRSSILDTLCIGSLCKVSNEDINPRNYTLVVHSNGTIPSPLDYIVSYTYYGCPTDQLTAEGIILGRTYRLAMCFDLGRSHPLPTLSAKPLLMTLSEEFNAKVTWFLIGSTAMVVPAVNISSTQYVFYVKAAGNYILRAVPDYDQGIVLFGLKLEYLVSFCNSTNPISCEGKCVRSYDECKALVIRCPDESPFKCSNNTCVSAPQMCSNGKCESLYECWNGACVDTPSKCPILSACPNSRPKRCFDGCHVSTDICPPLPTCPLSSQLCVNGLCAATCEEYNGCYYNLTQCTNGKCVEQESECSCLTDNCQLARPYPVERVFNVAEEDLNLEVLSDNLEDILCFVEVPRGTIEGFNQTVLAINQVANSLLRRVNDSIEFYTSPLSLSFLLNTDQDIIFQKNVTITCVASLVANQSIEDLCLAFIDKEKNKWSCVDKNLVEWKNSNSTTNGSRVYLSGTTNHFTDFAVLLGDGDVDENSEGFENPQKNSNDKVSSGVIIGVVVGAVVIIIIGVAVGAVLAKKRRRSEEADLNLSNDQEMSLHYSNSQTQ